MFFMALLPSKLPSLCVRLSLPLLLVGLLLSATARAQVSYTGTAANQNFGSQAIGSTSTAKTFSFSIKADTTVGSIGVVTTGVANLDFDNATGSTCTAKDYTSAATCTVDVTFTPGFAGSRMGAVVFFSGADKTGKQLGSVLVRGIGSGPQIAYSPSTATAIEPVVNGIGLNQPICLTVDAAGNLFIAGSGDNRVVEVPVGGGAAIAIDPTVNGVALNTPSSVAVDGAGDLFIADEGNNRVVEVPAGGGAATDIDPTVNGKGLASPWGLAVDGAGDLFIADGSPYGRVVKVPAGGGAATAISPMVNDVSLFYPNGVAVDGAGDLFIADTGNNRVVEVPTGGGAATAIDPTVNGSRLSHPWAVAVDGVGDLFIVDFGHNRVVEVPTGGGAATAISLTVNGSGLWNPVGVAVDGAGDLFIADPGSARVVAVHRSQPPTLNFPTATYVGSTDTTDGTQTVQIQNIGNEALTLTALSYPADFSEASGDTSACTGSTSLSAGQECDLPVQFTPQNAGALSESVTLTDNALNVTGTQQSIAVTGTGKLSDHFLVTSTATVQAGVPFTITIAMVNSSGQPVTSYNSMVSFSSSDPKFVNPGTLKLSSGTGQTVVNLLTPGTQTITAADTVNPFLTGSGSFLVNLQPAALTSPAPGATLAGFGQIFTWTPVAGATGYTLWLGSTADSGTLFYGHTKTTSLTAYNLPVNGETIYARLYTYFNGVSTHTDSTFTACLPATLTTPAQNATLAGFGQIFTWAPVAGATGYTLRLGSTADSGTLFYGHTTTASLTAYNLPVNGETIYARLYTYFNGVSTHTDSTFTACLPATLTTPAQGATLAGFGQVFTWVAVAGATGYTLRLGSTLEGTTNLFYGNTAGDTLMAYNLPVNGKTIYARLYTNFNGVSTHTDSTFTAVLPATPTSPTPGATLGGSSQTFTWVAVAGATGYTLRLGSTPGGTANLFYGDTTGDTLPVNNLPVNGETIYARLYTYFNGVSAHTDTTYTAK